jgi:hypothetical protein
MQRETAMKLYIFILFILHSLSYSGFDEGETKPENEFSEISNLLTQPIDCLNKSVETPKTNLGDELVTSTNQQIQGNPISETDDPSPASLHESVQSLLVSIDQIIYYLKKIEKVILPPKDISVAYNSFDNYKGESLVLRIESLELESNDMTKNLAARIESLELESNDMTKNLGTRIESLESKYKLHIESMSHFIKASSDSIKETEQQHNKKYEEIQKRLDQLESIDKGKLFSTATTSTATQTLSDNDINPTSEKTQKRLWRLNRELQCKMQPDGKGRGEVNPTMDKKRSSKTAPDNPKRTKRSNR